MIPAKDAADAVSAASVMLNNFDIPKGLVREGSAEDFHLGYTQWSVIADMSHKVYYYYWTMYDRRMRSVDLSKLDFAGKAVSSFPLDQVRTRLRREVTTLHPAQHRNDLQEKRQSRA